MQFCIIHVSICAFWKFITELQTEIAFHPVSMLLVFESVAFEIYFKNNIIIVKYLKVRTQKSYPHVLCFGMKTDHSLSQ